ncbi:MAG: hypothetical protein ACODAU_03860 [Myxococcota bacterium]
MRSPCTYAITAMTLAAVLAGCQDQETVGPVAVALTEGSAPFATSDDAALYIVERRVELPIREPRQADLDRLGQQAGEVEVPFPRLPWVERGDYELEVDWVVKNLTDEPVSVTVTLNGFNEFHEYVPSFSLDNDDIIPDFGMWEWSMRLEPHEERTHTTREEHLDEVAVDLATVVNGLPNANMAVSERSHSSLDARVQEYIPDVIPALTGFRIGLRVLTGGGAAPELVLEATVRVRDDRARIVRPDNAWELPEPEQFTPAPVVDL